MISNFIFLWDIGSLKSPPCCKIMVVDFCHMEFWVLMQSIRNHFLFCAFQPSIDRQPYDNFNLQLTMLSDSLCDLLIQTVKLHGSFWQVKRTGLCFWLLVFVFLLQSTLFFWIATVQTYQKKKKKRSYRKYNLFCFSTSIQDFFLPL